MKIGVFICTIGLTFQSWSQFNFDTRESELKEQLSVLRAAQTDAEKKTANEELKKLMFTTLQEPTIFTRHFTQLNSIGEIESSDGLVRIVNWNVEMSDESQVYTCYVVHKDAKTEKVEVTELVDKSFLLPPRPEEILDANNWYGCLYYQIVPFERSGKTVYVVLGWDGAGLSTNSKLIDVISFSGNGVKLGAPIFKTKDATYKRLFFEHSNSAVMSLRYEEEYNRIVFDHLSPESPNLVGFYEYYVPDMSYDAYVPSGNKWVLKEDVVAINKDQHDVKIGRKIDAKTGEIEMEEVENEWVDPTSPTSLSSKEVHIAALPEKEKGEGVEVEKPNKKPTKEEWANMTAQQRYDYKHRNDKKKKGGEDEFLKQEKKRKK